MPGVGLLDHTVVLLLVFWEHPYCSPQWLYPFTLPSTGYDDSLFSTHSPEFTVCRILILAILTTADVSQMGTFAQKVKSHVDTKGKSILSRKTNGCDILA